MARSELSAAAITLALLISACDGRPTASATGSITVQLPPARPSAPAPGFSPDIYQPVAAAVNTAN